MLTLNPTEKHATVEVEQLQRYGASSRAEVFVCGLVLSQFGKTRRQPQSGYREFVSEDLVDQPM